eukprot:CAMPEP_0119307806 /NCGR_PEP_ID=MMETSP1333-20130426/8198_1 /TAXON_ID=418940 /ORGANISM="Scyphosphaera apsteinii, Strain RCC1455" /LENGTH=132 /DNA_ID=CAMNT_0007311435 /DNA_START=805 /DNA_END=1203 /DNA_ORIENTATION=+
MVYTPEYAVGKGAHSHLVSVAKQPHNSMAAPLAGEREVCRRFIEGFPPNCDCLLEFRHCLLLCEHLELAKLCALLVVMLVAMHAKEHAIILLQPQHLSAPRAVARDRFPISARYNPHVVRVFTRPEGVQERA